MTNLDHDASRAGDPPGLLELLRRQDGVVSLDQARDLGLSERSVEARVTSGRWVRTAYRVYRAADHPNTLRARTRAAMLSAGRDAVLVGAAALWWWRIIDVEPTIIEIAVPRGRCPRPRRGVRFLRRTIDVCDRVVVDGLTVAKKAPAVLDAAAALPLVEGAGLLDRALNAGSVGLDELRAVHWRTAGRRGAGRASQLLTLAAGGARSRAERLAHAELRRAGIEGWTPNLEVRVDGAERVVLDLALEGVRVAVEIDGWTYHRDLRAFVRDASRQNALIVAGWIVIRTNWYELMLHPEVFVANVRAALARAAAGA